MKSSSLLCISFYSHCISWKRFVIQEEKQKEKYLEFKKRATLTTSADIVEELKAIWEKLLHSKAEVGTVDI